MKRKERGGREGRGGEECLPTRFSTMLILLAVRESRIRGCLGVVVLLIVAVVLLLLGAAACACQEGAPGMEQGVDEEGREKESRFWG